LIPEVGWLCFPLAVDNPAFRVSHVNARSVRKMSSSPDRTITRSGVPGTLLRVWEQSGQSGEVELTLPSGFKATRAQPVTLRGEKAGLPLQCGFAIKTTARGWMEPFPTQWLQSPTV